jgi:hypothetical protein
LDRESHRQNDGYEGHTEEAIRFPVSSHVQVPLVIVRALGSSLDCTARLLPCFWEVGGKEACARDEVDRQDIANSPANTDVPRSRLIQRTRDRGEYK